MMFDDKGVGSLIYCRSNVCRTPQPSQMYRLTLFLQFSGKDIGKSNVCPTDRLLVDGLTSTIADLDNEQQECSRVHYEEKASV